jgi:hypothetical protein
LWPYGVHRGLSRRIRERGISSVTEAGTAGVR